MIERLQQREREGHLIRVGLAGAGAMGQGIAAAIERTPGMRLEWVTDLVLSRAQEAASRGMRQRSTHRAQAGTDTARFLNDSPIDVFVEASTAIFDAVENARRAVWAGAHVVWMNAEADHAFGGLVAHEASEAGLIATSDAGDQHGVLARLIDETRLWGWETVQAGNIKGFLDTAATPSSLAGEAVKRRLDPRACCAYTDGTKLAIEMALIGNGRNLRVPIDGMRGPAAERVEEALLKFDLEAARESPEVDYLLGALPGGGVYVIGYQEDADERFLLDYYKLGKGPFYVHYRPCHLCHVETPYAIALAALDGRAVLAPRGMERVNEVFAVAKRELPEGLLLEHSIGSPHLRGALRRVESGESRLPVWMLHDAPGARLKRKVKAGAFLMRDDVEILHPGLQDLVTFNERFK